MWVWVWVVWCVRQGDPWPFVLFRAEIFVISPCWMLEEEGLLSAVCAALRWAWVLLLLLHNLFLELLVVASD